MFGHTKHAESGSQHQSVRDFIFLFSFQIKTFLSWVNNNVESNSSIGNKRKINIYRLQNQLNHSVQ